jgi:hypothetical protein
LVFEPTALVRHFHRRDYADLRRQLYGYGVGLTAYFSRCLYDDPKRIFDLISVLPRALRYLLSPRSERRIKMQANYPMELQWLQYRGMAYGPLAFLRSRRQVRHIVEQFGPFEIGPSGSVAPGNVGSAAGDILHHEL